MYAEALCDLKVMSERSENDKNDQILDLKEEGAMLSNVSFNFHVLNEPNRIIHQHTQTVVGFLILWIDKVACHRHRNKKKLYFVLFRQAYLWL